MPFKSKAQQAFMFATEPKIAKEMASKTSKKQFAKMPDKVKAKVKKKSKM
jgi:hypothetical protein